MNEILEQHVDKNEMTAEIIQNSFKAYIDQFDPEKIYLFKSEVDAFSNMSDREVNRILYQYQQNNFTGYKELNNVIQNAIHRARLNRRELFARSNYLFQSSSLNPSILTERVEKESEEGFTNSENELKKRIEDQIIFFISQERQRYGNKSVLGNKEGTLRAFENRARFKENQYLYQDESGQLLPSKERENLFVIHLLKALTRSLDSHTTYLKSNEVLDMKIRLEKGFQGIGVVLERKPEGVVVTRLVKDSPAEKSGLVQVNDQIQQINGKSVEGDAIEQLVERLRERPDKTVDLLLKRKIKSGNQDSEKIFTVKLKRELIEVDEGRVDAASEPFEGGVIGKITLQSFYQGENGLTSEKDIRQAIKDLQKQGELQGLILDLRENTGGFLKQAVRVAGLFVTNGVIVVSKFSDDKKQLYRDLDGKTAFEGPLIILTSKATASAAEIVAQVLQDYGIAVVVGDERTYGKGTIQSQTVTDGKSTSHFKVTVGKYYTVSGKTPQKEGVKADVVVPSYFSKELIGEEYLDYALEADTVAPAFNDSLTDIPPGLRPWFVRYYMPSLQQRETQWKEALPELREKSEKRLLVNEDYLRFQNGELNWLTAKKSDDGKDHDFQMQEAVNILKDMIRIEKKVHRDNLERN
ncbi:MAG: S41 family peptidase [Waddliaceae bacterium]